MTQAMENSLASHDMVVQNIDAAAKEDARFEKILKFKKGEYFIGEDPVPLGTEFLAHAASWVKVLAQVRRPSNRRAQDLSGGPWRTAA